MTEPTQTPSFSDKEHARLLLRITHLESQLRTQASEHSLANRRLEDEIGRLQARVKQLEGTVKQMLSSFSAHGSANGMPDDYYAGCECFKCEAIKASRAALSTPTDELPKAQTEEPWAREKAAFAQGRRIQYRATDEMGGPWVGCGNNPFWGTDGSVEYRVHPDDAPPVQAEEKPATVPLAVAEKLAEALELAHPARVWDLARQFYTSKLSPETIEGVKSVHDERCKAVDESLATFQASTKE